MYSTKDDPQALNTWVSEVRRQLAPWQSQGVAGLPDGWVVSKKINVPQIYRCLETAVGKRSWVGSELEQVAKAMALWQGPERQVRQIFELPCSARAQP